MPISRREQFCRRYHSRSLEVGSAGSAPAPVDFQSTASTKLAYFPKSDFPYPCRSQQSLRGYLSSGASGIKPGHITQPCTSAIDDILRILETWRLERQSCSPCFMVRTAALPIELRSHNGLSPVSNNIFRAVHCTIWSLFSTSFRPTSNPRDGFIVCFDYPVYSLSPATYLCAI